jgi:glycosyltransferase involved in cell wall biosynthesis
LFEYLASRRPIISSDLPVLQEVLNPQNAILVPAHDLDAWVRAIDSLQTDPSLRDRLAGQACQDSRKYTWEMRAARILEGL